MDFRWLVVSNDLKFAFESQDIPEIHMVVKFVFSKCQMINNKFSINIFTCFATSIFIS